MTRTLTTVLAVALTSIARLAWAQEPDPLEIEQLEADAHAHRDAGKAHWQGAPWGDADGFAKCGDAFVAVYNADDTHPRPDELLWNAAECYEAAHKLGAATQARVALLERYANSPHAQKTLLYLAYSYAQIAYYEKAAERFEQYAAWYSKDEDTPDALHNAYLFRVGLSQREQAERDLTEYERLYERKDHQRAAAIFWSRRELLDADEARREHALEYIKKYGRKAGLDRLVVAEAVVAQIDWRRSCPEPLLYDACITVERKRLHPSWAAQRKRIAAAAAVRELEKPYRPPKRCGVATQAITTVHRRNTKLADDAQARFKAILKLIGVGDKIEIPQDDWPRIDSFRTAWGMAMVYRADARFEEYLSLELPEDLSSQERAWEFVARKQKFGHELWAEYANVKATGSPHWVLAAAARAAMVSQTAADQLHRAKVPPKLRTEAQVTSHCAALADVAKPFDEQALVAWEYCLRRSTEYQFFNEFSYLCEEQLIRRGAIPATSELFGEPTYASSRPQIFGVLDEEQAKQLDP